MTPRERYFQDPQFNQLVQMLFKLIENAEMTPTELREALMLAMIIYEERNPRPILFSEIRKARP